MHPTNRVPPNSNGFSQYLGFRISVSLSQSYKGSTQLLELRLATTVPPNHKLEFGKPDVLHRVYSKTVGFKNSNPYRACRILQDYGGETLKPTWIYCNYDILASLDKYKSKPHPRFGTVSLIINTVDKHGKTGFRGGKNLKGSQHYPKPFGVAIRKVFLKHEQLIRQGMLAKRLGAKGGGFMSGDQWNDAKLGTVIEYLLKP